MKTKKIIASFVILADLSFGFLIYAQTSLPDGQDSSGVNSADNAESSSYASSPVAQEESGDAVVLASMAIENEKIISQDEADIIFGFDLESPEEVLPNVKCAIELLNQNDKQRNVADRVIDAEKVTLSPGKVVHREIRYSAPKYLVGTFDANIECKNEKSLMLAMTSFGEVTLSGNSQLIDIDPKNCFIQIQDDPSGKKYTLSQGVDISVREKLIGTCEIENKFGSAKTITPVLTNYYRSQFGDKLSEEKQASFTLNAGEKKLVQYEIPKIKTPQAYDAVLQFMDAQGEIVSNQVAFHYVMQGESATIQNIRFDKDAYLKGEVSKIQLSYTLSADYFQNSRSGGTQGGNKTFEILIVRSDGKKCASPFSKNVDFSNRIENTTLEIPITNDCSNFNVAVSIHDQAGNVLDQMKFNLKGQELMDGGNFSQKQALIKNIIIFFIVIIFILSLILIFIKTKNPKGLKFLVFFFFGTLFLLQFDFAYATFCRTFTVKPWSKEFSNAIYTGCASHYGNESVVSGGAMFANGRADQISHCDNDNDTAQLRVSFGNKDENIFSYPNTSGDVYGSAQKEPGHYYYTFTGWASNGGSNDMTTETMKIKYEVKCKPSSPATWVSTDTVNPGDIFTAACYFGELEEKRGDLISFSTGAASECHRTGWATPSNPYSATFACTAGNEIGTFNSFCKINESSPDYYCSKSKSAGDIKVINDRPTAFIDQPDADNIHFEKDADIPFSGHGKDEDGSIVAHKWYRGDQCTQNPVTSLYSCSGNPICECSGDPMACTSYGIGSDCRVDALGNTSFSAKFSAIGTHTIFYRVQDNNGKVSIPAIRIINIDNPQYSLNVSINGTGTVTLTSGGSPVNCSGICSYLYDKNAVIEIEAVPGSGYEKGTPLWTGNISGNTNLNPRHITMNEDKNITANFKLTECTPDLAIDCLNQENYCSGSKYQDNRCHEYVCTGTKDCKGWKEIGP
jgi:hypothetical protein